MPDNLDHVKQPDARYFYEKASEVDQAHLDQIIRNICADPRIDNEIKFALPAGRNPDGSRRILVAYSDGRFVLVFHQLNHVVSILNIGYAGEFWDEGGHTDVGPIAELMQMSAVPSLCDAAT